MPSQLPVAGVGTVPVWVVGPAPLPVVGAGGAGAGGGGGPGVPGVGGGLFGRTLGALGRPGVTTAVGEALGGGGEPGLALGGAAVEALTGMVGRASPFGLAIQGVTLAVDALAASSKVAARNIRTAGEVAATLIKGGDPRAVITARELELQNRMTFLGGVPIIGKWVNLLEQNEQAKARLEAQRAVYGALSERVGAVAQFSAPVAQQLALNQLQNVMQSMREAQDNANEYAQYAVTQGRRELMANQILAEFRKIMAEREGRDVTFGGVQDEMRELLRQQLKAAGTSAKDQKDILKQLDARIVELGKQIMRAARKPLEDPFYEELQLMKRWLDFPFSPWAAEAETLEEIRKAVKAPKFGFLPVP
jgi:hypothetical protein